MNASTTVTHDDITSDDVPLEVVDYVRSAFRFAIGITLMYGAFSCLTLVLWTWLAGLLALILAVFSEKVVRLVAGKQMDAAAQFTADKLTAGFGWMRKQYAARTAK